MQTPISIVQEKVGFRSLFLFFFQRLQILLPFHREEIFFFIVAFLAGRHQISLRRFPALSQRQRFFIES